MNLIFFFYVLITGGRKLTLLLGTLLNRRIGRFGGCDGEHGTAEIEASPREDSDSPRRGKEGQLLLNFASASSSNRGCDGSSNSLRLLWGENELLLEAHRPGDT